MRADCGPRVPAGGWISLVMLAWIVVALTNDPGTGVLRHADAGYEIAERAAREVGIRIPMLDGTHAPAWRPPD